MWIMQNINSKHFNHCKFCVFGTKCPASCACQFDTVDAAEAAVGLAVEKYVDGSPCQSSASPNADSLSFSKVDIQVMPIT